MGADASNIMLPFVVYLLALLDTVHKLSPFHSDHYPTGIRGNAGPMQDIFTGLSERECLGLT